MVSFGPGPLYPHEECRRYPFDGMLGGSIVGLDAVEKRNSLAFAGNRTPIPPQVSYDASIAVCVSPCPRMQP
jgi:hypothetical protein